MKHLISNAIYILIIIMIIDLIGFIMWALSGQVPPDEFFIGSITRSILTLFI